MHRTIILSLSLIALLSACADQSLTRESESLVPHLNWSWEDNAVIVTPSTLKGACQTPAAPFFCWTAFPTGWLFYVEHNGTTFVDQGDPTVGSFVTGPGSTVLHGVGGAQISVTGNERRNLASYEFAGTPLADITALKFTTYNPSAGNGGSANRSAYLNFNVDFNGTDTWQRRLVFVPSANGTVLQDTWQEWDAINGGNALWTYSGGTWPVTGGTAAKPWSQILSDYPGVRIRVTDAHLGLRVGEPYASGYTENISSFTFGTASGTTVYDFEPWVTATTRDVCKNAGWQVARRADGSTFKNQGDCVSYVNTGN